MSKQKINDSDTYITTDEENEFYHITVDDTNNSSSSTSTPITDNLTGIISMPISDEDNCYTYQLEISPRIELRWHKTNPNAIIPTKDSENAGFDIYTTEDNIILAPYEKRLFATGLQVAILTSNYWLAVWDRGSTGSKGIHVHCGVIDNGYRGEIFICLCNDNDYGVCFTSDVNKVELKDNITYKDPHDGFKIHCGKMLYYPTSKAIAQLVPIAYPYIDSYEVDDEDWDNMPTTKRGDGKLGSSNK